MKWASSGYTFIEVMIVFAISTLLFISAVAVFTGQQGETQFNQSMQDISSKIKSIALQINSGVFSDYANKDCTVTAGDPPAIALKDSASGASKEPGSNEDCLLLGRAIQIAPDQSKLYIYTVIGTRAKWVGGVDTGEFAQSFDEAAPSPAISDDGTTYLLTDDYTLLYGAKFTSSSILNKNGAVNTDSTGTVGTNWNIAGLYTSLSGSAGAGQGATAIVTVGYPYAGDIDTAKTASIKNCIKTGGTCAGVEIQKWRLCFKSANGNQTSQLTLDSTPAGLRAVTNDKCDPLS